MIEFEKTLFISDLDGTLLDKEGFITDYTADLLNRLIAGGMNFTIGTARSLVTAADIMNKVNLKIPAVLSNGIMLYDMQSQQPLLVHYLPKEKTSQIFNLFEQYHLVPMAYLLEGNEITLRYKPNNTSEQNKFIADRRRKFKDIIEIEHQTEQDNMMLINIVDRYGPLKNIHEAIEDIEGISSVFYRNSYNDDYFLEIFSHKAGKRNTSLYLKDLLGMERIVAFGDEDNDLELLKDADLGVVVENGSAAAKKAADIIIGSNFENSVADYINRVTLKL